MIYFNGNKVLSGIQLNGSFKLSAIIDRSVAELRPIDFDGVINIGERAFMACDKLTSVELGKQVKTIGQYAFGSCPALADVVIPDNVTKIDSYAFNGRADMVVTIGSGVTEIGNRAFFTTSASHLEIHMKRTAPPTLGSAAFGNSSSLTFSIVVPAGCGEAYKAATNWSTYADYITEESA